MIITIRHDNDEFAHQVDYTRNRVVTVNCYCYRDTHKSRDSKCIRRYTTLRKNLIQLLLDSRWKQTLKIIKVATLVRDVLVARADGGRIVRQAHTF